MKESKREIQWKYGSRSVGKRINVETLRKEKIKQIVPESRKTS